MASVAAPLKTSARLTLALGIPTRGRAAILKETLTDIALQTYAPDAIFVVYFQASDIDNAPALFPHVKFIQGTGDGGSTAQRNCLLEAVGDRFDLIFIQDDDFFSQREYLERTVEVFATRPDVVATTGKVLQNGATGPGYSVEHARAVVGRIKSVPTLAQQPPRPAFNTDGCNMGFRLAVVQKHNVRFDERMPGYAWYEDIDFSRRMLPYGAIVEVPGSQGIHLGAKVGKTSGVRFGYSQVANPVYLFQKGVFPMHRVLRSIGRNLAANVARTIAPEPYIDRRGRLRGNMHGFRDFLAGRLHPGRILDL